MATKNAIDSANPIEVARGGTGVASTTAYGVITGGTTSTGALQNAGAGTSTQYFRAGGSSALPSFGAQNGSGALILISTQTASSSATITFTSGITSTYNNYLLVANNVIGDSTATFRLRYSTDGGSNYIATGYLSGFHLFPYNSAVPLNANNTIGYTLIPSTTISNGTASATAWLMNLTSGVGNVSFVGSAAVYYSTSGQHGGSTNVSLVTTASLTVNALQIIPSAGSIATGSFSLYGLTK